MTQPEVQNAEKSAWDIIYNQEGKIGYIIAWLMGVPASLLFLIFLIRGH